MHFYKKLYILLFIIIMGCMPSAKDQLRLLEVGMNKNQVFEILGEPKEINNILFIGQNRSYEVWCYDMIPTKLLCPSEALPRFIAGIISIGLSEVIWTWAESTPHWVYFLDNFLVYTSPAFNCYKGGICKKE